MAIVVLLLALTPLPARALEGLRDGDLIFQTSRSAQSQAIALATHSVYTHMGIIFLQRGEPFVLEAVEPTRYTPLDQWVARAVGRRIVVKRLKDADTILTASTLSKMRALAAQLLGRRYDLQFRWDDTQLYCSELVYKLYERGAGVQIGRLQAARTLDLGSPAVQRKMRERFGGGNGAFNPEEPVITPQAMFEDGKLVTVFSGVAR
jgi:hypothetical protein